MKRIPVVIFLLLLCGVSRVSFAKGEASPLQCATLAGDWVGSFSGTVSKITLKPTANKGQFRVSYLTHGREQSNLVQCLDNQQSFGQLVLVFEPKFGGHCLGYYEPKSHALWSGCLGSGQKMISGWYKRVAKTELG
ncbi:hypothetical protein [Dongshaea marina]|uniref:hypothetical protein n=1 Tax=Dongshaea marina TaxID=2047966 RepID=UPI000D3E1630|nr:hypothetical protein [Dongshaea marina]